MTWLRHAPKVDPSPQVTRRDEVDGIVASWALLDDRPAEALEPASPTFWDFPKDS